MKDHCALKLVGVLFYWLTICCGTDLPNSQSSYGRRPNIIIFLADDMGWGDLASYGHPTQEEGPIDQMAKDGIRFTQWYAPASFCTPSRAAMLTGRYPFRSGLYGELKVILPGHGIGLDHDEVTIAEALRDHAGYKTGIVGKWHLGINQAQYDDGNFLPHTQGFDYVGTILPFTLAWNCDTLKRHRKEPKRTDCLLYRNATIIEQPIDLAKLTHRLVLDAQEFIHGTRRDQPFFLYVSLPQTHTPMFNHPDFFGKSRRGIYGDQVNEMSWAIGEVLGTVQSLGIEKDTLALFLSDHGPHREIGFEGGSPGPFAEGKGYYGEGGLRVPAIALWPGTIAAGRVSSNVVGHMDIFPTLLHLAGIPLESTGRPLDGHPAIDSLLGTASTNQPRNTTLLFYCGVTLAAARVGRYKVYVRRSEFPSAEHLASLVSDGGFPRINDMTRYCPSKPLDPWLVYDVERDPGELWPVSTDHLGVQVVSSLRELSERPRPPGEVRDPLLLTRNWRRKLIPCCNPPYCLCSNADVESPSCVSSDTLVA